MTRRCTSDVLPGLRSVGRICCGRPFVWPCCIRGKRPTSDSWTSLLALYYDAKRAAADGRLGTKGREQRVAEFEGPAGRSVSAPLAADDARDAAP